ncbi:MAG: hypothetical protein M1838_001584 [Thelocarpon superellum]|nr:MAG: hypothetical protein M1838_001584 [Thelocarpon superellum]
MDEHIVWLQPHRNAPWHGLVLPGHVRSALDVMQRLVRDRWTMEVSSGIVDHEVVQYERRLATARRLLGSEPTPDSDATPSTESTSPASSDQRPATTSPTASSTESKTPEALSPPATTSPATAASPGSSSDAVTVLPPPPPPIVLILLQLDMVPPEECSWCSSNVTGPMGDDLCHALWIPGHDVIPALICEDCAALRWQVLSHDRHERFLPLRDMAGSPVKRTATCSICKGTAESKCSLCALLVCSGCESLLLSMFDGQLDHLMAAKGLEGLRNDACLLFSNDFVLALLKEAAVEECEWHFRDADQSI